MLQVKRVTLNCVFILIMLPWVCLSGCTEVKTAINVLSGNNTSLSFSAFDINEMKSGKQLVCSLMGDRTLRCLGSGLHGALGRFQGAQSDFVHEVSMVATGKNFTCVTDGKKMQVFCFGENDKGQLGNSNYANSITPVPVLDPENASQPLRDVKKLVAGDAHACALQTNGRAVCWGDNSFGQSGNPSLSNLNVKTIMEGDKHPKPFQGITDISAKGNSTCIIAKDTKTVYCFGEQYMAKRKHNWQPEPVELAGSFGFLTQVKQVSVGRGFACALATSSEVFCWGRNELNQLGSLSTVMGVVKATQVQIAYPVQSVLNKVDQISVGDAHACALHRDEKTVFCWGDNSFGQLGNTSQRGLPEQVALGSNNLTLKGVKKISAGPDRTCIITSRDEVFCWGNGEDGLLGNEKLQSYYPIRVLDANEEVLNGAQDLSVGFDHSCVIEESKKIYCFGRNTYGQLGTLQVANTVLNEQNHSIDKIIAFDTYQERTCVVYGPKQTVGCFGGKKINSINEKNNKNTFALEDLKYELAPYQGASSVVVGRAHVCVMNSKQQMECQGEGASGQLGLGDHLTVKSGVVVNDQGKPLSDVWQASSNGDFTCALKQEEGSVWCWGSWKNQQWSAAKIIRMSDRLSNEFVQVVVSQKQICGIRGIDRMLYCTSFTQKNLSELEFQPQVDLEGRALKKVISVTSGYDHMCAVNEEGALYCWGNNSKFQLGLKTYTETVKAVKVPFKDERLKKITRASAGYEMTCVNSLGQASLFCFGQGVLGTAASVDPIEYPL